MVGIPFPNLDVGLGTGALPYSARENLGRLRRFHVMERYGVMGAFSTPTITELKQGFPHWPYAPIRSKLCNLSNFLTLWYWTNEGRLYYNTRRERYKGIASLSQSETGC